MGSINNLLQSKNECPICISDLIRFQQLLQTVGHTLPRRRNLPLLVREHARVERDQLQVGGGRRVIVPPQLTVEADRHRGHARVHLDAHVSERVHQALLAARPLQADEGARGDGEERVGRPLGEPVDGAAVDQGGEHAAARPGKELEGFRMSAFIVKPYSEFYDQDL